MGSSLHSAAHKGHLEVVRLLLDRGAAVDVKNQVRGACGAGMAERMRL